MPGPAAARASIGVAPAGKLALHLAVPCGCSRELSPQGDHWGPGAGDVQRQTRWEKGQGPLCWEPVPKCWQHPSLGERVPPGLGGCRTRDTGESAPPHLGVLSHIRAVLQGQADPHALVPRDGHAPHPCQVRTGTWSSPSGCLSLWHVCMCVYVCTRVGVCGRI